MSIMIIATRMSNGLPKNFSPNDSLFALTESINANTKNEIHNAQTIRLCMLLVSRRG